MEKICPKCNQSIIAQNYSRHLKRCDGTGLKVYVKQNPGSLNCQYCNKLCHNINSLRQHEIRCSSNPDRKDWDKLRCKASLRKGTNKENNEVVARCANTLKQKYANGYVSPLKGVEVKRHYIYQEHNVAEIAKWLQYIEHRGTSTAPEDVKSYIKEGYIYLKSPWNQLEQNYVMQQLLGEQWSSDYTVHHINGIKCDNRKENLLAFINHANHARFHASDYAYLIYDEATHLFSCEMRK